MKLERIFRSTRIAHGLVLYSYPPQAITLSPSRRSVACIIAMSVEPREIGKATHSYYSPPNCPQFIFEQGAGMIPCVPSQDLIRLRKINDFPRIWAGNHQNSSEG